MPLVAHLTHNICFISPVQRADLGRVGWLTTCIPQPTTSASSEGRSRGRTGKPKDLDYTSMDHNPRYYFTLIWVLILERDALHNSHPGSGDAETERKTLQLSILPSHTFHSHLHLLLPSAARNININRML